MTALSVRRCELAFQFQKFRNQSNFRHPSGSYGSKIIKYNNNNNNNNNKNKPTTCNMDFMSTAHITQYLTKTRSNMRKQCNVC